MCELYYMPLKATWWMEEISEACTPLSRDRFGRVLENVPHTYTVQTCFPLPVPSPKLLTLEKEQHVQKPQKTTASSSWSTDNWSNKKCTDQSTFLWDKKFLHQLKQGGLILQKHIGYSASINSKHKPACECLQNNMTIDSNTQTKHSIFVAGFGPA